MATRLLATMGASSSYTVTFPNDAKVSICITAITASNGFSVNGANIFYQVLSTSAGRGAYSTYLYVGAGQTVTFATGTAVTAVISSYEG